MKNWQELFLYPRAFPGSSVGKESTCNVGDPTSVPGSGRPTGEGIGYPLHYSWAFLVTLMVKNPPATQEIWVQSLDWEDPLEKGKATHSSILAWRISWTIQFMGSQKSQTRLSDSLYFPGWIPSFLKAAWTFFFFLSLKICLLTNRLANYGLWAMSGPLPNL